MGTPPSTESAVTLLGEIQHLMELKGENPFSVRAFEKAARSLEGQTDLASLARAGRLTDLPGIGKGIAEILTEFLLHGKSTARDELAASLPRGLLELVKIPGLGPKKALKVIEELGVHSSAELEYACRENRLLKLPGFGPKSQQKILEGIHFLRAGEGQQRLADVFTTAEGLVAALAGASPGRRVSETGALRRRAEVLDGLDFVVELPRPEPAGFRALLAQVTREAPAPADASRLPVRLHYAESAQFGSELARTTATSDHWRALGEPARIDAAEETEFYAQLGLPWIPPEMRERGEEVELARSGALADVLPWDGVRGIFHNHTVRSDGSATLEEMVAAAESLGYEYIGISDHSQSAVYAHGLTSPALAEQEREVREVQARHPKIRVFWGIESDILADGSLDYPERELRRFDFVIASVHSRFGMDREAMTARILAAIRHPCTRFLGHATGRLLLGRAGYALDMERVIAEAARCDVAIEINANPARLDIDWRWGPALRASGTRASVNPDAHETAGLQDTRYGIAVARKALLPRELVVNAGSVDEVEKWLRRA